MNLEQPATKKPLYTGDPDAKFTLCLKKLRRHLQRDIAYGMEPKLDAETGEAVGSRILVWCKHCKQNPILEDND